MSERVQAASRMVWAMAFRLAAHWPDRGSILSTRPPMAWATVLAALSEYWGSTKTTLIPSFLASWMIPASCRGAGSLPWASMASWTRP